jgi:hypothetical protein
VEVSYPGVVGTLRFMQGRFGELIEQLDDLAARFPAVPVNRASLAAVLAEADRPVEAQAEVERLTAGDLAAVPRDLTWSWSLATLASACHYLGDAERGAKLYGLLEPASRGRRVCAGRWRQGWDSNPWRPCDLNGFRVRRAPSAGIRWGPALCALSCGIDPEGRSHVRRRPWASGTAW